jgi:hypothetical protein
MIPATSLAEAPAAPRATSVATIDALDSLAALDVAHAVRTVRVVGRSTVATLARVRGLTTVPSTTVSLGASVVLTVLTVP